jgi:ELWxxDGT repeat protein
VEKPSVLNGKLYVVGSDGNTYALWRVDQGGNVAEAVRVASSEGNPVGGRAFIGELTAVGETLFFSANLNESGPELWVTDGTPEGTRLLKDIVPGSQGSSPFHLTRVAQTLFFFARDAAGSVSLWRSDGTQEGTVKVRQVSSNNSTGIGRLVASDSRIAFVTSYQDESSLWFSDGRPNGQTTIVRQFIYPDEQLEEYAFAGDFLYFRTTAMNSLSSSLWVTDGTIARTAVVHSTAFTSVLPPSGIATAKGELLVVIHDPYLGVEIARTGVVPGDVNLDDRIDLRDFVRLKAEFGNSSAPLKADVNQDGEVDLTDFRIVKDAFGAATDGS